MSWLQKSPKLLMGNKRSEMSSSSDDFSRPSLLRSSSDNTVHSSSTSLPSIVVIGGALSNSNMSNNINNHSADSPCCPSSSSSSSSSASTIIPITPIVPLSPIIPITPLESYSSSSASTLSTPSSPVINAKSPSSSISLVSGGNSMPDSPQPMFFLDRSSASLASNSALLPAPPSQSACGLVQAASTSQTTQQQQQQQQQIVAPSLHRPRVSNVPPAIVKLPPLSIGNKPLAQQQQGQRTTPTATKPSSSPLVSTSTLITSTGTSNKVQQFQQSSTHQRHSPHGLPHVPRSRGRGRGGPHDDHRRRGATLADSDKETESRKMAMVGETRPRSKSLEVLNSWDYQPWETRRDSADEAQPVGPESPRAAIDNDALLNVEELTKSGHKSIHFKSSPALDAGSSASPRITRERTTKSPNRPATPNIVFELNDENQLIVTSGTKEQLMDYLCNKNKLDLPFLYSFMLTFHYFMEPEELFEFLIRRYESNNTSMDGTLSFGRASSTSFPSGNLSSTNDNSTIDSIRQNVIIVFLVWIDSNYCDFDDNQSLCQRLVQFSLRQNSRSLKEAIDKQRILRINTEVLFDTMRSDLLHNNHNHSHGSNGRPSKVATRSSSRDTFPTMPSQPTNYLNNNIKLQTFYAHQIQEWTMLHLSVGANAADILIQRLRSLKKIVVVSAASKESKTRLQREDVLQLIAPARESYLKSFLDHHPHDLAKQLTLMEFAIFQRLRINELYNKKWTAPKTKFEDSPNVMALINMSNRVASWVATEIVTTPHPKKRVEVMKRFITMGEYCRKIKNYNTMMEIVSGLTNCSVTRLRDTWCALPSRYHNSFRNMSEFFNTNENWKQYRAAIKSREQPCLPYLGLFLQDINFLEDGNPNYVQPVQHTQIASTDGHIPQHINFKKLTILANFFKSIIYFQKHPYTSLMINSNVQNFLDNDMLILPEKELNEFSRFVESPVNPLNKLSKFKWSMI